MGLDLEYCEMRLGTSKKGPEETGPVETGPVSPSHRSWETFTPTLGIDDPGSIQRLGSYKQEQTIHVVELPVIIYHALMMQRGQSEEVTMYLA